MEQQRNYPDKITFKVKHFDEYHDIVIDWNDERYVDPFQQIFEQLESITGVPTRYTSTFTVRRPVNYGPFLAVSYNNRKAYPPGSQPNHDYQEHLFQSIREIFRDGERYHLEYHTYYDHRVSKRISMDYGLVNEIYVTEGACSRDFCQYKCTESHFKRLIDLVSKDELNAKITQLVQPFMEPIRHPRYSEADKIFKEFNIKQYLRVVCFEQREVLWNNHQPRNLYLRIRG